MLHAERRLPVGARRCLDGFTVRLECQVRRAWRRASQGDSETEIAERAVQPLLGSR
jgi:hypothetical protein